MAASAARTSASMPLRRVFCARASSSSFLGGQIQRRGLKALRHGWRGLIGSEAQGGFELGQQRAAGVLEVGDFGFHPVLLDLGAQHVLQRHFADFVLCPGEFRQVGEQAEVLPVDADFLVQEVKLVVGALDGVGALQGSGSERKVLRLAFGGGHRAGGPQLARARETHHQARHERSDDLLDVHLEGQLRVRQRARHRDALDGSQPVKIRRLDLRLVQQGIGEEIAEAGVGSSAPAARASGLPAGNSRRPPGPGAALLSRPWWACPCIRPTARAKSKSQMSS